MSIRLILCACFAASLLAGCAHKEYVWIKRGGTTTQRDRDLKVAHMEAEKAYPSVEKLAPKPEDPVKAEEMLGEMRRSVQALYMDAHGWTLVYFDKKGRPHAAPHGH